MAYNVQLKKSDGSLYEDVYVATKWSLISDKPSTFTPTSHNHNDIYYTETEIDTKLDDKVDKVTGKGLSTNDYTTTDKNKLAGIASGAEVNVQSDWNATSGDAFIKNKPTIPTVTNDLTNTLKTNYNAAYTHSTQPHAPSNAQKNSDITKGEIEAKLVGEITTHSHALPLSIPLSKISTGSTYTDILIGTPDGGIGTLPQSTFLSVGGTAADSSKLGGQLPSYYLNYNNFSNKPTSLKNPYSLNIKQDGVILATYNGSSTKTIDITPSTKHWTLLGITPHSSSAIRYYTEDIIEYMVIYTDLSTGKYSDITEVVYGPGSLIHGMPLPGYLESSIIVTSSYIEVNWNPGQGVGAKNNVIIYAR